MDTRIAHFPVSAFRVAAWAYAGLALLAVATAVQDALGRDVIVAVIAAMFSVALIGTASACAALGRRPRGNLATAQAIG